MECFGFVDWFVFQEGNAGCKYNYKTYFLVVLLGLWTTVEKFQNFYEDINTWFHSANTIPRDLVFVYQLLAQCTTAVAMVGISLSRN